MIKNNCDLGSGLHIDRCFHVAYADGKPCIKETIKDRKEMASNSADPSKPLYEKCVVFSADGEKRETINGVLIPIELGDVIAICRYYKDCKTVLLLTHKVLDIRNGKAITVLEGYF